jgi:fatty acid desaturase
MNNSVSPRLEMPKEFLEKSDLWGVRNSLWLLGVPVVFIALLPMLDSMSPWLAWAAMIPIGVALSKVPILIHEAAHGTLFRTPVLNQIIGHIAGWWTTIDFVSFVGLHRQHHARVGRENDPQLLDYGVSENTTRPELAWHLLRPLIGWNVQHMFTLVHQCRGLKRPYPVTFGELAGLASVQGMFFLLATHGGQKPWLGLIAPIAATTVGLFMSQLRGFCEHVPMPGEAAAMRLRSHTSNRLEGPFFHFMNYNYHGEHHRYPRVPSQHLPAFSRWLQEHGKPVEHAPSYMATLIARWRACPPTRCASRSGLPA